jgi:hypothetical protein
MLGMSDQRVTTVQFPHSYLQLQYLAYLIDAFKEVSDGKSQKTKPILDLLKVNLQQESNILHVFALNEGFLRSLSQEIRNKLVDLGDKKYQDFIYWVLMPMNITTTSGRRPFSMAIY